MRGASSRVRFAQYFSALATFGIECHFSPLFQDNYLMRRYADSPLRFYEALKGYLGRLRSLLTTRQYDVIWLEGELFPGLPAVFEELILRSGVPYVVDYDDAIFARYEKQMGSWYGGLYREKFSKLLSGSASVSTGNRYLANWASSQGAKQVTCVPTVVDANRYMGRVKSPETKARLVVGWIGSPHTANYLSRVSRVLERVNKHTPIELMTIGAGIIDNYPIYVKAYEWSVEQEVALIDEIDIGIMPMRHDAWALGKCGYKLIQYMARGKPVVASAWGANMDIVSHGVTGFLAQDEDDWVHGLSVLARSQALRGDFGRRGLEQVRMHYTTEITSPMIAGILMGAVRGGR